MIVRIGKVTNIYPASGKVKVLYEDRNQASAEIPMLTFNEEFKMPAVGDRVLTLHMENAKSKAFCLGTYWNAKKLPQTAGRYRKDLGGGAYIEQNGSETKIYAPTLILSSGAGSINLADILRLSERIETLERRISELMGGN